MLHFYHETMSTKVALIIFILVGTVIFPAVGYYMDYRKYRRDRTIDPKDIEKHKDVQS